MQSVFLYLASFVKVNPFSVTSNCHHCFLAVCKIKLVQNEIVGQLFPDAPLKVTLSSHIADKKICTTEERFLSDPPPKKNEEQYETADSARFMRHITLYTIYKNDSFYRGIVSALGYDYNLNDYVRNIKQMGSYCGGLALSAVEMGFFTF